MARIVTAGDAHADDVCACKRRSVASHTSGDVFSDGGPLPPPPPADAAAAVRGFFDAVPDRENRLATPRE
jgi:hypothetical protein